MFHKVVFGYLKGLIHALTDRNTWNYNNKLAPAVFFIQLKHCFDIHIGLACACFHFDIKAAPAEVFYKLRGEFYIVFTLYFMHIFQKLFA